MQYDVIVIGGGPAGMMAAGRAGQLGQSVLLLEKNKELGVKLLITGKDRCNVTHFTENKNELIDAYGKNRRFLYSGFSRFGNKEVMEFFESKGVRLKIERGQRVFPVSDKSSDIRNVLLEFLQKSGVEIRTRTAVVGINRKEVRSPASYLPSQKAGLIERSDSGVIPPSLKLRRIKSPAFSERRKMSKVSFILPRRTSLGLVESNYAKASLDKFRDSGVIPPSLKLRRIKSPAFSERVRNRSAQTNSEQINKKIITEIVLSSGERLKAKKFIITTGGLSYPATGSTGDGYDWARELGHNVIEPRPALSPIVVSEWFISQLEGLSLKNIELSVYENNKKIDSKFGEMLFTSTGISGPVVLNLSKKVGELLESSEIFEAIPLPGQSEGEVLPLKISHKKSQISSNQTSNITLKLDLKPALDFKKLDQRIQRDFQKGNNKQFKNILEKLLPKKFIPVIILKSKIDPEKQVNLITKEERKRLVKLIKGFSLQPEKLLGFGKAIITTGGVDLKEVDSKTMQSRLISNLYFAGEVLDLDGPTGGYNLQIAWTTGYVAGEG